MQKSPVDVASLWRKLSDTKAGGPLSQSSISPTANQTQKNGQTLKNVFDSKFLMPSAPLEKNCEL